MEQPHFSFHSYLLENYVFQQENLSYIVITILRMIESVVVKE